MEQHHHQHAHMDHQNHVSKNEVDVSVSNVKNNLSIYIEDKDKRAVKLVKNHEKLMHLIIVSSDLQEFYHLHPTQVDEKTFHAQIQLKDNKAYQAFVDVMVEGKSYLIRPIRIANSKENHEDYKSSLELDSSNSKDIQGVNIELESSPFVVGKKVELNFKIADRIPDPYLGALGHVVITNEDVDKFIHVHPKSNSETKFEAHFEEGGKYKLWAEFKFGNDVIAFPYVFKVEEEANHLH
ncbi:hypothetical protein HNQ94_000268 [Salirhabdus euzebyi]|uniref:Secreted protein n=1 Tax=Salirhabdus euzebyi TaxID=394506 RepID=A0A841PSD5_9BACI|nr:hypothetical protein [Salirhabdus euzebyi]MBB6451847.1 hypothetical protein [Salirhabdus euzebyi]